MLGGYNCSCVPTLFIFGNCLGSRSPSSAENKQSPSMSCLRNLVNNNIAKNVLKSYRWLASKPIHYCCSTYSSAMTLSSRHCPKRATTCSTSRSSSGVVVVAILKFNNYDRLGQRPSNPYNIIIFIQIPYMPLNY